MQSLFAHFAQKCTFLHNLEIKMHFTLNMPGLLDMGKYFLSLLAKPGALVMDLTAGNGHDTLFLAQLAGREGQVFSFDIQNQAISNTRKLLSVYKDIAPVELFLAGHEYFDKLLPQNVKGCISAAVFNLGYLPGSNKEIVTHAPTTLQALNKLADWLRPDGGIVVHIYMGHPEGALEGEAVIAWAKGLAWNSWSVASYEVVNKPKNREVLLFIVKKQPVHE